MQTHGDSPSGSRAAEYESWRSMKQRCNNVKNADYPRYGGRGIRVCSRWNRYESFLADMGRKPSAEYTLDRKDNNSGYCPENCRWATSAEQARNRRDTLMIRIRGVEKTLRGWAAESGNSVELIRSRIRRGVKAENAVWDPLEVRHSVTRRFLRFMGITLSVAAWASCLGVHRSAIHARINRGESVACAFSAIRQTVRKRRKKR